jgi:hypothetical protein
LKTENKINYHILTLICAIVIIYAGTHLYFFWQTPTGQTPVLDGAETILLAERIFQGNLEAEPFYRAMLYPAFLACFRFIGFTVEDLHQVASFTGVLFHILNTAIVGIMGFLLWKNPKSLYSIMLLYGLYPVALHFAVEPLDITLAISFLSSALLFALAALERKTKTFLSLSCLFLGIGTVLRANILPAAAIYFWFLGKKQYRSSMLKALIFLAVPLLAAGMVNYFHSGQFMILPWQGAFNLYAANHENANGKYFQQTIFLPDRDLSKNPARMESELLFFKAHPDRSQFKITEFNQYWQSKTLKAIKNNPSGWISLMFKKFYYLLNNFEQYNNKTYSFHKQLSPVLRFNLLCFGLLLVIAFVVIYHYRSKLWLLLIPLIFLSFGILAFYVSARFRLLLVPLLAVISGGIVTIKPGSLLAKKPLLIIIVISFISFSGFFNATDTSTYNSDRLLLAHACSRLRLDSKQVYWANQVLANHPENLQAIRVKLVGFTNMALAGKFKNQKHWKEIEDEINLLSKQQLFFPDTLFIAGCYYFSAKNNADTAKQLWEKGLKFSQQKDIFHAALILANLEEPNQSMIEPSRNSPILWYALASKGIFENKDDRRNLINQKAVDFLFNK